MKATMTAKMMKFEKSAKDTEKRMKKGSKEDKYADNNAVPGYKKGGALRGQGIAKRGFSEGGKVQTVQVKGVGAARARTAKIC
jgi:hypothetical protein